MGKIITLKWDGEEYTLNETEAFLAADAVEEFLTLGELVEMRSDGNRIRFAKIAQAYAAMLSEAGCRVSAQQVHRAFTDALKSDKPQDRLTMAVQAIDWLIMVVMDGSPSDDEPEGGDTKNEDAPAS